jgi:asparagine synthase (glutamine-hydrolysing)
MGPLSYRDEGAFSTGEPEWAPNLFHVWQIYREAEAAGVRVVLDGSDGDTVISHGWAYLAELAGTGRWISLYREARALSRRHAKPMAGLLRRHLVGAIPGAARASLRGARARLGRQPAGRRGPEILNPSFARRIGYADRYAAFEAEAFARVPTEQSHHLRRLTSGFVPSALEAIDRLGAWRRVEPRHPFYDRRLVEFCFGLPPEQKLRDGWTRVVLRRGLSDLLPPAIEHRVGKSDLTRQFTLGLLRYERSKIDDIILARDSPVGEYVNLPLVRRAYAELVRSESDDAAILVWPAVTLGLWLNSSHLRIGLV